MISAPPSRYISDHYYNLCNFVRPVGLIPYM